MRWPWQSREEERQLVSISDPALAQFFGIGTNFSGVPVGESTVLGIAAVWRAISLISGTIATLPMNTVREIDDRTRIKTPSFLDDPGGVFDQTSFSWKEEVLIHLLLHGNAFLVHLRNEGGALVGLFPIHPLSVSIDHRNLFPPDPLFTVTLTNGQTQTFNRQNMTHIMGPTLDGIRGLSVISLARNSFGTMIAGDRAAARMFNNGATISGLVTPEEDVTKEDAKEIKDGLDRKLKGWENAGDIAFVNRKLKFTPWTMSAVDAQFLESRQFQIEEIARWFGIPPFELMQTEKQTSWGTGIEAQQRGLARTVLNPWTMRLEQSLSRLLPRPRFVSFDFSGVERPTPELEIQSLINQVQAGIMTIDEARAVRNMPPLSENRPSIEPIGELEDAIRE